MNHAASIGIEIKRVDRTPVKLSTGSLTGVLSTRANRFRAIYKLQLNENATSATTHSDENINEQNFRALEAILTPNSALITPFAKIVLTTLKTWFIFTSVSCDNTRRNGLSHIRGISYSFWVLSLHHSPRIIQDHPHPRLQIHPMIL